MSIAFTKEVVKKGRMRVSQGQCVIIAIISAAVDAKKISQYKARCFLDCSIRLVFFTCAKIRKMRTSMMKLLFAQFL